MSTELFDTKTLPENAYKPLPDGELYLLIVPPSRQMPEITARSLFWGVLFCVIFSVASAYSALKVGQGMEAAIPISILAIGLARVHRRRSSLLENVIITGMGGASAAVVSGAVFTVPALYALHLDPHPVQTIFICLAGGCLGILFLIPLRRYFVRQMQEFRMDLSTPSRVFATCNGSPEVRSTAFVAQPPDLPPVPLMDMGFAIHC